MDKAFGWLGDIFQALLKIFPVLVSVPATQRPVPSVRNPRGGSPRAESPTTNPRTRRSVRIASRVMAVVPFGGGPLFGVLHRTGDAGTVRVEDGNHLVGRQVLAPHQGQHLVAADDGAGHVLDLAVPHDRHPHREGM